MNCPCEDSRIVNDPEYVEKKLGKLYEQNPDADWDYWDEIAFAEMKIMDCNMDCPYLGVQS